MIYAGSTVTVTNWINYNPRSDVKRNSWLRLENDVATSQRFFGLSCEIRWLWIVIICLTSQNKGNAFTWRPEYIEAITGLTLKTQEQALRIFQERGYITVHVPDTARARPAHVTDTSPTNERTDETNETDERVELALSAPSADALPPLAELWNINSGSLPKVKGTNASRNRKAASRWKEKPDRTYWTEIIQRITKSSFCNGGSDRGWKASFDWLLQPETHLKVFEGKYDNSGEAHNTVRRSPDEAIAELERKFRGE